MRSNSRDRGGARVTVSASEPIIAGVAITVADTGVGIGAEDLSRVGEPFFQARSSYDRRHDGTGLGVSIVKGLLALHGGWMEIEVASAKERASAFICRLISKARGNSHRRRPRAQRIMAAANRSESIRPRGEEKCVTAEPPACAWTATIMPGAGSVRACPSCATSAGGRGTRSPSRWLPSGRSRSW